MAIEATHNLTYLIPGARYFIQEVGRYVVTPRVLFAIRLALSVCLALFVTYWLELQNSFWAATTAAITCQPNLGASLQKGRYRVLGTIIGAIVMVGLLALFSQQRNMLIFALALWCGLCGCAAVLLRNYASYAAALSGITAAIIFADTLSDPSGAVLLAIVRVGEISIGIGSACFVMLVVSGDTASRQLSNTLGSTATQLWKGFSETLFVPTSKADHLALRHTMIRSFPALRNQVDASIGESSVIQSYRGNLNGALNHLLRALIEWRNSEHLPSESDEALLSARDKLSVVFRDLEPSVFVNNPVAYRERCEEALSQIKAIDALSPSSQILLDAGAHVSACLAAIAECQALLGEHGGALRPQQLTSPVIVDPLPAILGGLRVFCAVLFSLFLWIETAWPVGYFAAVFAAVATLVFASFGDQALAKAKEYSFGTICMMVIGAGLYFGLLPSLTRFSQLVIVLTAFYLIVGFMQTGPTHSTVYLAISVCSLPMLGLGNPTVYSASDYFNLSSAIIVGSIIGTCFFLIIPALTPAEQEKRLILRSVTDFRRYLQPVSVKGSKVQLAVLSARFCALPSSAADLPFSQLMAIYSAIEAVETLRNELAKRPDLQALDRLSVILAKGSLPVMVQELAALDLTISSMGVPRTVSNIRAKIAVLSQVLKEHEGLLEPDAYRDVVLGRSVEPRYV